MSVVIPAVIVFTVFLLVSGMASFNVHDTWTGPITPLQESAKQQAERVETLVSIVSAGSSVPDCQSFSVDVNNPGQTSVADFSEMDLIVEYTGRDATNQLTHLQYVSSSPAANQWTLSTITPDTYDPNIWNPEEKATFTFQLSPPMKHKTSGLLTIGTPLAVTVSTNFSCDFTQYFHSETTDIVGITYFQLKNTAPDGAATTITSTFAPGQLGRVRPASNDGKFVFPLAGYSEIPGSTWVVTYRVKKDKPDFGFIWFTNAHDISLSQTFGWRNIKLEDFVPQIATGAVVDVVNTSTVELRGMVRGTEDTRDYMVGVNDGAIPARHHRWQVVKIDDSPEKRIEGYIDDTEVDFKLLGYTIGIDPLYFTTPPDITPGGSGSWKTVDVSANVDADADGVILLIRSTDDAAKRFAIREIGSSYNTTSFKLGKLANTMYLVGLDASKKFNAWVENNKIDIFLVGQTKGSVVYYVDDLPLGDPPFNIWTQLDADNFAIDVDANGLVFLLETTATRDIGLRHGDSTDNWDKMVEASTHLQGAVGINDLNEWATFIEDTAVETFIAAYTRPVDVEVHADMDVLVRQANGSVRGGIPLAVDVANSGDILGTGWQTLKASFTFPAYTVVDQTDYLEIDLFAEATSNISDVDVLVDFRIDDPVLASVDQMRIDF